MVTQSEAKLLAAARESIDSALSAPIGEIGALLEYAKYLLKIVLYEGKEQDATMEK